MTDARRETAEILKVFRNLVAAKQLAECSIELKRSARRFWKGGHMEMWKIVVFTGTESGADEVSYLNDFAKANGLRIELRGYVELTLKGSGTD